MFYSNQNQNTELKASGNINARSKTISNVDLRLSLWFLPSRFAVNLSTLILINGSVIAFFLLVLSMVLMIQADTRLSLQASARCQVKQEILLEMKEKQKEKGLTSLEKAGLYNRIEKLESEIESDKAFLAENYKKRIKPHLYFAKELSSDELIVKYDVFDYFDIWFVIVLVAAILVWKTTGGIYKLIKYPNDNKPNINLY